MDRHVLCLFLTFALLGGAVQGFEPADDAVINLADPRIYQDCDELQTRGGYTKDGLYEMHLNSSQPSQVYCRFEDGAVFTPIMQQKYGKVSFDQTYQRYMYGFGSAASGDFWLGLKRISDLTRAGYRVLTVTMQDCGYTIKTLRYNYFFVDSWTKKFRLHIGGYASSHVLPDDFSHNNGMQFATSDAPDAHGCASGQRAGWWYNYCTLALPTGHYKYPCGPYTPSGGHYNGIYYKDWHGFRYSLKYIKLELSKY